LLNYLRYALGKEEEIELCRTFDVLIATTERDRDLFRKDLPDQVIEVINNGVQRSFLEYDKVATEPGSLVFTGLMTHYPNEHGILFFLDKVFPLVQSHNPNAHLYIIGAKPSRRILAKASEAVTITGYLEDVRPYMARGEVFIIPLLIGGGIRGKALEAMAMRRPIVTTTIGCEGINLVHERSALFADSADTFAEAILRLQSDRHLRERLVSAAYTTVKEEYDWNKKGLQLDAVYRHAVAARQSLSSRFAAGA
jgi:glycosyltransferase involved in cell wall biosynthesis